MPGSGSHCLEVAAPSRLHFGLLSFGPESGSRPTPRAVSSSAGDDTAGVPGTSSNPRQFGGAGVMIEQPGLLLRLTSRERLTATGPAGDRAMAFAQRFAAYQRLAEEPRCQIDVVRLPRQHAGLGVGTSLGMAVAAGLAAWLGLPPMSAEQLAASVGRGRRSAVGALGFLRGGLIVEGGKSADDLLSPLVDRVELPEAWRFVAIIPAGQGLSGVDEEAAFRQLPPVASATSAALREELMDRLLPAARSGDFEALSESLYRFNRASGECYSAHQGGPYASRQLADLVAAIRAAGIRGVGQSSWGPTLFALLADQPAAERFVSEFAPCPLAECAEWIITAVSQRGATVTAPRSAGAAWPGS
jgi:beta-RFAP synthase